MDLVVVWHNPGIGEDFRNLVFRKEVVVFAEVATASIANRGVPGGESLERRLEKLQVQAATGGLREVEQAATRVFFISGAGRKIPNRAKKEELQASVKLEAQGNQSRRSSSGEDTEAKSGEARKNPARFGGTGRSCRRADFGEDEPHLWRPRAGASRCVSGDYGAGKKNLGQFSGVAALRSVFGIA
ncbi:hypothetical protein U1Q18_016621 [Sarracenia purpurea var. burkii]